MKKRGYIYLMGEKFSDDIYYERCSKILKSRITIITQTIIDEYIEIYCISPCFREIDDLDENVPRYRLAFTYNPFNVYFQADGYISILNNKTILTYE